MTEVNTDTYALSSIMVGGTPIAGFKAEETTYEVALETAELPKITATSANGEIVTVETIQSGDGKTLISLNTEENPEYKKYYIVNYRIIQEYEPVQGRHRYKVYAYETSSCQQVENPPHGMLDADLGTRWSADGDGEWLIQDLGEEKSIGALGIAFWKGNSRKFYFDILSFLLFVNHIECIFLKSI